MYRSFTLNCFITGFSCLLSFIELSRFFGIAPVSFHVFGTVIGEYGNIISRALKDTSLFILIGEEVFVIFFIGVDVITFPLCIGLILISSFSSLSEIVS